MSKYYELSPQSSQGFLSPEKLIELIILSFENYLFDEETAKRETEMRLQSLIEMGADKELIDAYQASQPIKCTIFNDDKSSFFSFDINVNQALFIMPSCEDLSENNLTEAVTKLASICNYKLDVEED